MPSAATVAGPDPEIAAKKQETITHTSAIPLLLCPTRLLQKLISRSEIPPSAIMFPPKMKNGMARSTNLLVDEYILLGTIDNGNFSYNKVMILDIPSDNAIGMFRKSNRKNEPNKINATILVLLLHRFEFFCSQLEITDDKNCAADRDPHSIQPFRPLHTCCFLS